MSDSTENSAGYPCCRHCTHRALDGVRGGHQRACECQQSYDIPPAGGLRAALNALIEKWDQMDPYSGNAGHGSQVCKTDLLAVIDAHAVETPGHRCSSDCIHAKQVEVTA